MPRKLSRPVTLARTASGVGRVPLGNADATPERLTQACRHAGSGAATVDRQGVRRIADPFDLLRSRNLLDRLDVAANETLWHAGDRLRRHWHGARLEGVSSVDLTRPSVDGGPSGDRLAPSEAAQRHRDELRRATDAIGLRPMPFVMALVIEGRSVASLRSLVRETSHARTADALALDRLREGLYRLCGLWHMGPDARPLPIKAWGETEKTTSEATASKQADDLSIIETNEIDTAKSTNWRGPA